ncbi:MAG: helix-hairpin-helix domain-containing protein [bacterium]
MFYVSAGGNRSGDKHSGVQGLSKAERIALLFFFILALFYAIWQIYTNNKVAVPLDQDILEIQVEVKGAVENPGFYDLPMGSKAIDAVNAAGGLKSNDTNHLDLDNYLEDGDVVEIPEIEPSFPQGSVQGDDSSVAALTRININTAGFDMLKSLDKIGDVRAQAIINYRNTHGRFNSISELVTEGVIPEYVFNDISYLLTVGD